ncbi:MAG: mechanosensitive ion channel family protein [Acidobacteria bacterium]|nr:mechanosensitive ion channel family protein [Acidobacteriota bacterium]
MFQFRQWFAENVGFSDQLAHNLINSAAIIVLLYGLRFLTMRAVFRQTEEVSKRYKWRKGITYITTFLAIFLVGRIWLEGLQSVATFAGLFAAGLTIALQDLVVNFAGWLFILWRRPFDVGDRIEISNHTGDVIDMRIFMFTMMEVGNWVDADQSTGRVIHVPNGLVFKQTLSNYHRGFNHIWNELPVLVTFESNWSKAKTILQEIVDRRTSHFTQMAQEELRRAAQRVMILYNKLTPIVWTNVKDSGVMLTIRYLCDPRRRRSTAQEIWEDILTEFAKHDDIDFAYPTVRYYANHLEGKPGTMPKPPPSEGVE